MRMVGWMALAGAAIAGTAARAQAQDPHAGHHMPVPTPTPTPAPAPAPAPALRGPHAAHRATPPAPAGPTVPVQDGHAGHATAQADAHAGHAMPGMDMAAHHAMPALLGPYAMTREASGTAWQPESAPMYGSMFHRGGWMGMAQGYATAVRSDQGGPRGDGKTFVESMAMVMASRPVGTRGRLGLRAMLSLDPLMGRDGYPLLLANGETADGVTELVDRQHPHDLFMELAASYSHDLGGGRAAFLYVGLPGEPALGPPTFMHRVSGLDNPEAPIGHHWFDSTHITWGVVTAGYSTSSWKIEASAFKGREPDQYRWDVEAPRLDSWSVRGFWNPTRDLSFQASTGFLRSPEQLHPDEDEQRTTASASYNRRLGPGANWATTVAWSLKDQRPGPALHAWLAETALRLADRHTLYARGEADEKDELFDETSPLHHQVVPVAKLSLGYQYELPLDRRDQVRLALGGLAGAYAWPRRVEPEYDRDGVRSITFYARLTYGDRRLR